MRAALVALLAHRPLGAEVAEGDVRLRCPGASVGRSRPNGSAPPAIRSTTQGEIEDAGQHEVGVDRGECGLEAGHPHRRLLERDLLFLGLVRRVVGGDALDRAVAEALDQRLAVGLGSAAAGSS